jgi:hypothetical protein
MTFKESIQQKLIAAAKEYSKLTGVVLLLNSMSSNIEANTF